MHDTFADQLNTHAGRTVQLAVAARLLSRIDGGDFPELADPIRAHVRCGSHISGTHGASIGRAANAAANSPRARATAGTARMPASGVSRTHPIGSHRENTHGHTCPCGEMASTLPTQWPHS